jgi:Cu/Ag efflux pump CusA
MNELWATLRNPRVSTTVALVGVLAAGFLLLWLGYRSSAALALVPSQLPFVVSGGVLGLAVVGTALALLSVHVDRVEAAVERRVLAELQRRALRIRQGADT